MSESPVGLRHPPFFLCYQFASTARATGISLSGRKEYQRSLPKRIWYECLRFWVLLVGTTVYRVRYSGEHNIPTEGGVLLVSNHQSHLDPPLIGAGSKRLMCSFARQTLFRHALLRWLIQSLDSIPVDIEGIGLSGIKEILRRLKRGEMVLIFPEGSRCSDGEIHAFQPGFAMLAARGKSAIVPVAIEGAFDAFPRHNRFPGIGVIHVHYGVPISAEEVKQYDETELVAEMERRVRAYRDEIRRRPVFVKRRASAG